MTRIKIAGMDRRNGKLCKPDKIYWCDGSEENENLLQQMVASGAATQNEKRPGCYLFRSHPRTLPALKKEHISSRTKEEFTQPITG